MLLLLLLGPDLSAGLFDGPAGVVLLEAAGLGEGVRHHRHVELAADLPAALHAQPRLRQGFQPLDRDHRLAPHTGAGPRRHGRASRGTVGDAGRGLRTAAARRKSLWRAPARHRPFYCRGDWIRTSDLLNPI